MTFNYLKKNIKFFLFLIVFILLYFSFFIYFYLIPNKFNVSIILFLGFSIVIIGFFLFFNITQDTENDFIIQFNFLSENSLKIILMLAMSLALLISPILYPETIIVWNRVEFLNYVRAITFIIGSAIIPGASIYNIFFPKNNLHERFKVEPFFLKITLYPLLSFSFIGISVLIIDQIGVIRNLMGMTLFLLILCLLILDLVIHKIRRNNFEIKTEVIKISKYTSIILVISFGILIIALGIFFGMYYLIPGDAWIGLAPNNYIGDPDTSPIEWGRRSSYYPMFWSYVSFGLSILCGLPYFNTNALLAPFCYLYATSLYLLTKAVLIDYKERYAALSTILITISSNLFYISIDYGHGGLPDLTFACEFYFFYKSLAYLLFIVALAFFIILIKSKINELSNDHEEKNFIENNLIILTVIFLLISFMLYLLPLLMGMVFIFLYCLFAENKKKSLKILTVFMIYLTILFVAFDLLMEFYLSSMLYFIIPWFFNIPILSLVFTLIPSYVLIYSLFSFSILFCIFIRYIYLKFLFEKDPHFLSIKLNPRITFKYGLFTFLVFLIIEIIVIFLEQIYIISNLDEKYVIFYYLNRIYVRIGFIGILSVFLSHYLFRRDKNLFFVLFSWIFVTILLASSLIFIYSLQSFSFSLNAINKRDRFFMDFWFKRIWSYSIIPLCILASFGLFKLISEIKNHPKWKKIFKNENKKLIVKYSSLSLLIFLTYSNLIIAGIWSGNINNRPENEKIKLLGWMSENIPPESNFLIEDDYIIRVGIFSMVNGRYFFFDKIFDSDKNVTENMEEIEYLIDEEIEYMLVHEDFLYGSSNMSKFVRNYLRPYFYNESEYETDHYRLYYAPYFD